MEEYVTQEILRDDYRQRSANSHRLMKDSFSVAPYLSSEAYLLAQWTY